MWDLRIQFWEPPVLEKEDVMWMTVHRTSDVCLRFIVVAVQSLSCVLLFETLWTVAHQATLSMGFSKQEYWSELPIFYSRGSSQPRDWTRVSSVSCIGRQIPYHCAPLLQMILLQDPCAYTADIDSVQPSQMNNVRKHQVSILAPLKANLLESIVYNNSSTLRSSSSFSHHPVLSITQ